MTVYQAIIRPHEVAVQYKVREATWMEIREVVLSQTDCKGHTYIENLGLLTDFISNDVGHPLNREDVSYIAKYLRETILEWSK